MFFSTCQDVLNRLYVYISILKNDCDDRKFEFKNNCFPSKFQSWRILIHEGAYVVLLVLFFQITVGKERKNVKYIQIFDGVISIDYVCVFLLVLYFSISSYSFKIIQFHSKHIFCISFGFYSYGKFGNIVPLFRVLSSACLRIEVHKFQYIWQ